MAWRRGYHQPVAFQGRPRSAGCGSCGSSRSRNSGRPEGGGLHRVAASCGHRRRLYSRPRRRKRPASPPTRAERDPKGIRTPVAGMKTRCPSPLDDGAGCSQFGPIPESLRYSRCARGEYGNPPDAEVNEEGRLRGRRAAAWASKVRPMRELGLEPRTYALKGRCSAN